MLRPPPRVPRTRYPGRGCTARCRESGGAQAHGPAARSRWTVPAGRLTAERSPLTRGTDWAVPPGGPRTGGSRAPLRIHAPRRTLCDRVHGRPEGAVCRAEGHSTGCEGHFARHPPSGGGRRAGSSGKGPARPDAVRRYGGTGHGTDPGPAPAASAGTRRSRHPEGGHPRCAVAAQTKARAKVRARTAPLFAGLDAAGADPCRVRRQASGVRRPGHGRGPRVTGHGSRRATLIRSAGTAAPC